MHRLILLKQILSDIIIGSSKICTKSNVAGVSYLVDYGETLHARPFHDLSPYVSLLSTTYFNAPVVIYQTVVQVTHGCNHDAFVVSPLFNEGDALDMSQRDRRWDRSIRRGV